MSVNATSSQQINSVAVDKWFSLPIALGVVAEEIEVDKDRVVWTVGLYIQRQQGEEPCGLNREARVGGYVSIPNVAKDLSGDRLVMTGAAIEDQRAFGIGCNWS